jgi:hypothetical protein
MIGSVVHDLATAIALRKFKEPRIAAHVLRFGGTVAGKVDRCDSEGIWGWIYDVTRPDAVLDLEILIDGKTVYTTPANVRREDIGVLLKDHGIHGFQCSVLDFSVPSTRRRIVKVRLSDRPRYVVGTFRIRSSDERLPSTGISQDLNNRLTHIFNHISATHEDSLRRFDKLDAAFEQHRSQRIAHLAGSVDSSIDSRALYELPVSAIAGVGQFRTRNSSIEEIALRLEHAIMKARQDS